VAATLFYIRFMDDILVLAPTRWRLRGAVKTINRMLDALDLEKHSDKTFIGRIERGFDSLGYRFTRAGLSVARKSIENFLKKTSRLTSKSARRIWMMGGVSSCSMGELHGLRLQKC
jgi:RNA-directed DNA polymerase